MLKDLEPAGEYVAPCGCVYDVEQDLRLMLAVVCDDHIRPCDNSLRGDGHSHNINSDMTDDGVEPCSSCEYDMAENPDDPSEQWQTVDYCDACVAKYESVA